MPDHLLAIVVDVPEGEDANVLAGVAAQALADMGRHAVGKPKRTWTEPYSGTLADRVSELEGKLAKAEQARDEIQAKLDHHTRLARGDGHPATLVSGPDDFD